MIKRHTSSLSKIVLFVLLFVVIYSMFNLKRWKQENPESSKRGVIQWDIISYYAYLPATFIHKDLSLSFMDTEGIDYFGKCKFWPQFLNEDLSPAPKGKGEIKVIKTTMGMSFMYAPFFFMGHAFANVSKYKPNGFSEPYEFFLIVSCIFYLFFGLVYLRRILLNLFSEGVTALTLITVVLGTNLYYYISEEPAMSHAYSFALIIGFIYQGIRWIDTRELKKAIYLGLLGGLIVLIRPVNILIFLFPLFYGVISVKSLGARISFFLSEWKQILIIASCAFLVMLPQFIYWKTITGNWLFNSYVGEQFFFGNNHVLEGLFSYRKGWLVYTPIMIFALIGIPFLFKRNKNYFWPLIVFVPINIFVLFSWWSWWYGGSFGCRPMIDSYGLLAIPLAGFYAEIVRKKYLSIPLITLSFVLISFNLFQTYQRRRNLIHWSAMTKDAYWNVFLKTKLTHEGWALQEKYIQYPDSEKARNGEDEYVFNP